MLVLSSAVAFGLLPIFATLAYSEGAGVWDLLFVRFAAAFVVLGAILWSRGELSLPNRRGLVALVLLGAVGYFLQSALYFSALLYAPVSVVALILYTYPAFVTAASFLLGLERPSAAVLLTLAAAMCGIVLVANPVFGGSSAGVLLALGASGVYTCYIIVSSRVLRGVRGELATFFVLGGATASFGVLGVAEGVIPLNWGQNAWIWAIMIALVSTVLAMTLFFKGLSLVGPSRAAVLSTAEIVTSVAAASVLFGEGLVPSQAWGGVLIVSAALVSAVSSAGNNIRSKRGKIHGQMPGRD